MRRLLVGVALVATMAGCGSSGSSLQARCRAQVVAQLGNPAGIAWGPTTDIKELGAMTLVATTAAGPRQWWCSSDNGVVSVQPVSGP